jgi:hypothetical protein
VKLKDIAERINAHLVRLAQSQDANDLIRRWGRSGLDPSAVLSGSRVMVKYARFTRKRDSMSKTAAEAYLAALDVGFTGMHFDHPEIKL